MNINELKQLAQALDIDINPQPNLIYIFYTTPDGRVGNLSISVKNAKRPDGRKMSDDELAELMHQYPNARNSTILAVQRPKGNLHRWIDREDVKRILHTSTSSVKRWERKGLLTPARLGHKVYYDAEQVDRMLRSNIIQENGRLDKTALLSPSSLSGSNGS